MKRLTRIVVLCAFLLSIFSASALADPITPPPLYLPLVQQSLNTYTVTGAVRDVDGYPVAGVTVSDTSGATATTDVNGAYTLYLPAGATQLTATHPTFTFTPVAVDVSASIAAPTLVAEVACGDAMVNGTVDFGMGGWDFSGDAPVVAGTDATIFRTPLYSGRTGINPSSGLVVPYSTSSRARSQAYHIPSDAEYAYMGVWVYQLSSSAAVVGAVDRQLINILDTEGNLEDDLLNENLNTGVWTYKEYSLSSFIGQSIVIEFASINDTTTNGSAALYFDDVSLVYCSTALQEGECRNLVINGTFELTSGWYYTLPQLVPPAYVGAPVYAGLWSMRTGIPLGGVPIESFSEVWQYVTIPPEVDDVNLRFHIYTTSGDTPADTIAGMTPSILVPERIDTPSNDTVYAYVFDADSDAKKRLIWLEADNDNVWVDYQLSQVDLMDQGFDVRGKTIQLLFGAYNDSGTGVSAMYIDDVALEVCNNDYLAPESAPEVEAIAE